MLFEVFHWGVIQALIHSFKLLIEHLASQVTLVVEYCVPTRRSKEPGFDPWVGKIPLGEEMALHSSILTWVIQWTEECGGLQSLGLQRLRHDRHNEHLLCV